MFIKVIIPKESQDKIEGCYLNSDKITEMFYNKELKKCFCNVNDKTYEISKIDYNKIIKGK